MNNADIDRITKPSADKGSLGASQVAAWLVEIDSQKQKEKAWRTEAAKIVQLYEGDRREQSPFNILYSNTDTLLPALYNNTPRPAVGRRYKDTDPLAAAVALTMNRTLSFCMDPNNGGDAEFDSLVEYSILQALVPGRGIVRWKFDADYTAVTNTSVEAIKNTFAEGAAVQAEVEKPTGIQNVTPPDVPKVKNERVCGETVQYDRFLCGYALKWTQVPWVSFEHHMTTEELEENFGAIGKKVSTAKLEDAGEGKAAGKDTREVAVVYEVWDKTSRRVIFLSPGLKDRELRVAEDPCKLSGFFPCAEPLHFLQKMSSMIPQPVYNLYREQAEELNLITRRITAVMSALKVRGAYDGGLTEMPNILSSDDNTLVAIENVMSLDGKKLADLIFLMPLGELVNVLQQLYMQRGQIKQVIYEITGISDILRGGSVASESATAQSIKNQWGTLRLKSMQKVVSKWCRNNLRIVAEIAAQSFSIETFQQMTGLPYATAQQKAQAQLAMTQFQEQQQMQPPPQPGQPPAPPAQPPQQAVDTLATPGWDDIVAMLRNDLAVEYRIDIETNSTIADDMAEDQKNIGELLNALSQFLNGVAPLIANKAMPFSVAKTMMLGIVRKMAMGPEVEGELEKMKDPEPPEAEKAPAPPPPDPNIQLKQQAEQVKLQGEMQKGQQEGELAAQQAQFEMQRLRLEAQKMRQEMEFAAEEHRNKMQLEQEKALVSREKFKQQMMLAQQKLAQTGMTSGENNASL
jgi:hypothetical protein